MAPRTSRSSSTARMTGLATAGLSHRARVVGRGGALRRESVPAEDGLEIVDHEAGEADDLCDRAERRRHDSQRLLAIAGLHDHPGTVHAIAAAPVGVAEKV